MDRLNENKWYKRHKTWQLALTGPLNKRSALLTVSFIVSRSSFRPPCAVARLVLSKPKGLALRFVDLPEQYQESTTLIDRKMLFKREETMRLNLKCLFNLSLG
jgi:hypothetical protein